MIFAISYPDADVLEDSKKENLPQDGSTISAAYTLLSSSGPGCCLLPLGSGQQALTDLHDSRFALSPSGDFLVGVGADLTVTRIERGDGGGGSGTKDTKGRKKRRKKNDGSPQSPDGGEDGSGAGVGDDSASPFGNYVARRRVLETGHEGYDLSAVAFSLDNCSFATGDSFGGMCVRR